MGRVKTKSFELAVYTQGPVDSLKLALVLPGRLDTKDYPHLRSLVDYLGNRGYYAVSFDPPGTWESGSDIRLYTMTNYLLAINELIACYGNKPTLLVGHSRGGSMAVLAGVRNRWVSKFVSVMGVCSYAPGKYRGYPDKEWQRLGYKVNKRDLPENPGQFVEYRLPYAFLEDSLQYDMYEELKICTKPKLFIYGEHDDLVKPELVKEVCGVAAEPKEIAGISSDHDYRLHDSLIVEVNKLIGKFLDKYELYDT